MSLLQPILTDADREALIDIITQLAIGSSEVAQRRFWVSLRDDLVRKRSPEQIARMEKAKGLRAA